MNNVMNNRHRLIIFGLLISLQVSALSSCFLTAKAAIKVSNRTPSQGDTLEICVTDGWESSAQDTTGREGAAAGTNEPKVEPRVEPQAVDFNGHSYKLFPETTAVHYPGEA